MCGIWNNLFDCQTELRCDTLYYIYVYRIRKFSDFLGKEKNKEKKMYQTTVIHFNMVFGMLLILFVAGAGARFGSGDMKTLEFSTTTPSYAENKSSTSADRFLSKLSNHKPPSAMSAFIKNNDGIEDDYQADGEENYVLEDMGLLQNDQPERQAYTYGSMKRQPSMGQQPDRREPHFRQSNVHYTKEVVIKQGPLKGIVRTMHAQSGLTNVDQYLGIPYAAPPTGNGRFMPPGRFYITISIIIFKKI